MNAYEISEKIQNLDCFDYYDALDYIEDGETITDKTAQDIVGNPDGVIKWLQEQIDLEETEEPETIRNIINEIKALKEG